MASLLPGFAAALLPVAAAQGSEFPELSFSGFGTAGLVHSSEDRADFTSTIFKPDGAGYSHDWSADVDSRLGLQVGAQLSPRWRAVAQIITEQGARDTYQPTIEWLNLEYEWSPDLSLRIGRSVLDTFLYSESRKVGYAYPWVRPPLELYSQLPVTNTDGGAAIFRQHFGDLNNTVTLSAGEMHNAEIDGSTSHARQLVNFADTLQYGPFVARLAYNHTYLTIPGLNEFFENFRLFGAAGDAIADRYDLVHKSFQTRVVSLSYDPGRWFLIGEWAEVRIDAIFRANSAWYLSGGHRFGDFTPYVVVARDRSNQTPAAGLSLDAVPPDMRGFAAGLNAGLYALSTSNPVDFTWSVGSRWDVAPSVDLKLEYSHTDIGALSVGHLINRQPDFQAGGSYDLINFTVDFVF